MTVFIHQKLHQDPFFHVFMISCFRFSLFMPRITAGSESCRQTHESRIHETFGFTAAQHEEKSSFVHIVYKACSLNTPACCSWTAPMRMVTQSRECICLDWQDDLESFTNLRFTQVLLSPFVSILNLNVAKVQITFEF